MDHLPIEDVRRIIRLLGDVAALNAVLPAKRAFLLQGLAELVQADMWAWVHLKDELGDKIPMGFMFIQGGWQCEAQLAKFADATTSPAAKPFNAAMRKGSDVHRTRRRSDLFPDEQWFSSEMYCDFLSGSDIGEFLSSLYPLGDMVFSSLMFLRRLNRPAFSPRDVCITHIITSQIDWLHRDGTNVPAKAHVSELSTRQRQVLLRMIAGDSIKQIARKLSISADTVNDHIRGIYHRFNVGNRGKLLAQFLAGGPVK